MSTWVTVGTVDQVADDEGLAVDVGGKEVGVFKVENTLYAIEDVCPHAYALLSQGFVDGQTVECCLHGAIFDIPTGKCLKEPGGRDLRVYQIRQVDQEIQILDD
ncbi:MAG: non-heme iron oxygenase ferredoxin subunit [Rhodanobacter sp.]|uniref:Non-heme iron oxygenase ferredoxin subunit n=1 Tax=Rhodanobacter glycinis TaxID=582702 RepID=A0A5B9E169_9GAMM|nr:non-heme iron oxygenase ferredoxin subunit [Rhodanobacter glycinis]QEE24046.1 non-heme iron oxygenase ferredoxin subunit [Rhodanobacter glycinis]TAM21499.1 MAG: non-heme iron oxygenase ferredoxin subunit [Rhodanobacter sp.]